MISFDEFIAKYLGQSKGYPTDSNYKGECLSIVKLYIKECFGIEAPASGTGSAYGYWSKFPNPLNTIFEKIEHVSGLIPQKGWIAIWKPWEENECGHISMVTDNCISKILFNYAQNWTSKIFQLEKTSYNNVIGYLKPIKNSEDNMTEENTKVISMLEAFKNSNEQLKSGNLEGAMSALIGWSKDLKSYSETISNQNEKISSLENSINNLEIKLAEIEAKYAEKQKLEANYQKQLLTANENIAKSNQIIDEITTDRDTWRARYNNKNDQYNTDLETKASEIFESKTGIELIIKGFKKLLIKKTQ